MESYPFNLTPMFHVSNLTLEETINKINTDDSLSDVLPCYQNQNFSLDEILRFINNESLTGEYRQDALFNPCQQNTDLMFDEILDYINEECNQFKSLDSVGRDTVQNFGDHIAEHDYAAASLNPVAAINDCSPNLYNNDDNCALEISQDMSKAECGTKEDNILTHIDDQTILKDIRDYMDNPQLISLKSCNKKDNIEIIPKYSCDQCPKKYSRPCELKIHKRCHTGERPYACALCDKRFYRANHLKGHQSVHQKKSYACNLCNKVYHQENHLKLHLKYHEKKYKCSVCEKIFTSEKYLSNHKYVHAITVPSVARSYKCPVCDKNFSYEYHFLIHLNVHKKKKKKIYSCELCDKSFHSQGYLRAHRKFHKQQYDCPTCQKKFYRACYFTAHIKTHKI